MQQERELTISGFTSAYGGWVSVFTAIAMCCFAFSTIIGWGLYGTRCIEFLFGSRANKLFMLVYALVAIVGATMNLGLMWSIAETFNGLMVIPNLIAVFLLSGVVVKLVKEYFAGEGKSSNCMAITKFWLSIPHNSRHPLRCLHRTQAHGRQEGYFLCRP